MDEELDAVNCFEKDENIKKKKKIKKYGRENN